LFLCCWVFEPLYFTFSKRQDRRKHANMLYTHITPRIPNHIRWVQFYWYLAFQLTDHQFAKLLFNFAHTWYFIHILSESVRNFCKTCP
jgi:hypothetical protein